MAYQFATTQEHKAYIRFINNTCFNVEVIWMKETNEMIYNVLAPQLFLDVNTFSTHPWIFREHMTKSKMVVTGKEVFIAKSWIEEHKRLKFNHPINLPLRTLVQIQMPALDLRLLCLLKIANILRTKDDINTLELPAVLQQELALMISNKAELSYS